MEQLTRLSHGYTRKNKLNNTSKAQRAYNTNERGQGTAPNWVNLRAKGKTKMKTCMATNSVV